VNPKTAPRKQVLTTVSAQDPAKAEIFLDAIFRLYPDLLFYLDQDGTILEYRAGDLTLLYMPPEQFLGKKMQEILPANVREEFRKALEETKCTGRITAVKYKLETQRGERWFNARFILAPESKITVIVRDITDQVQALERVQRQLTRMASLRSIDAVIMSSFDLQVTLSVVLREITNQLKVDAADVLLFNPKNSSLEFVAGKGFRTPHIQNPYQGIGHTYAGRAVQERQTVHAAEADLGTLGLIHSADTVREGFVNYYAVPLLMKGNIKGVLEIYHRTRITFTDEDSEFLDMVARHIALALEDSSLFNDLQCTNAELVRAYDNIIEAWSRAMDMRDREAEGHSLRIAEMTINLAQEMGMNTSDLVQVRRGALLHDIGRLGDPGVDLRVPDPVDGEARGSAHTWPEFAYNLLSPITYLHPALDIPWCYHEKWDGSGYPRGLKGDQIPMAARIFAVVNAWDLLTSPSRAGSALTKIEARQQIVAASGSRFDPAVVKVFLAMIEQELAE